MEFAIIAGIVAIVIALLSRAAAKTNAMANERQRQYAEDFFRRQTEERERWFERAVVAARVMKIVPRDSSPQLHKPVYDCASDDFELPCAHDSFEGRGGSNVHRIGWITSFSELESMLRDFSGMAGGDASGKEAIALVEGADFLLMVTVAQSLLEPGGLAYRVTRTGDSEWFVWYWRVGMRRVPEDPPFLVYELAKDPSIWSRREEAARNPRAANSNFRAAAQRCTHRG